MTIDIWIALSMCVVAFFLGAAVADGVTAVKDQRGGPPSSREWTVTTSSGQCTDLLTEDGYTTGTCRGCGETIGDKDAMSAQDRSGAHRCWFASQPRE